MKNPVLAVVVIVGLLLAAGCSPAEVESPTPVPSPSASPTTVSASPTLTSEPSPSPEPSPEPTFTQELSSEQQEVYDLVHEHFTLHNELMKDPHSDWQPLINTVTGEALQMVLSEFGEMRTEDHKRIGDEEFVINEVGPIATEGSHREAVLDVCTDSGESDIIDVSGDSVVQGDGPVVLSWTVRVVNEDSTVWMIDRFRNQIADSCTS